MTTGLIIHYSSGDTLCPEALPLRSFKDVSGASASV